MNTALTIAGINTELSSANVHSPVRHRSLSPAQPSWDGKGPEIAPKTILVPLTLGGDARVPLGLARDIAMKSEAKVILLHVVQLNIAGEEYGIPRTRLLNDLCQNAELHLQQLADRLGGNVVTEVLICEGRPGEVIVETATRLQTDMIVMRSHGRRGWQSWFRRNTARTVLRQAPCKVCLVLAENCDATVPLMIADHNGLNLFSERLPFREKKSPSQSLFRGSVFMNQKSDSGQRYEE